VPESANNQYRMSARLKIRRAASLLLTVALLLWAEIGVAQFSASGHGMQCHAQMAHPSAAATAVTMSAGCCPHHLSTKLGCPSHPGAVVSPAYRPDCCAIGSRPERPRTFLIAAGASADAGAVQAFQPTLPPPARVAGLSLSASLPFVPSVFDQKADLRI
jgi:hypothetical protein